MYKISFCLCVTCNTFSFIVIVINLFVTFSLIRLQRIKLIILLQFHYHYNMYHAWCLPSSISIQTLGALWRRAVLSGVNTGRGSWIRGCNRVLCKWDIPQWHGHHDVVGQLLVNGHSGFRKSCGQVRAIDLHTTTQFSELLSFHSQWLGCSDYHTKSNMYQVWLPLRLKAKCLSSHWRHQDAMQLLRKKC